MTATANACTGYLRRNTTGMTIAATIGSSSHGSPNLIEATPMIASQNAGTPSTSFGWRLSQAYTADTAQGYAGPCLPVVPPGADRRPPEGGFRHADLAAVRAGSCRRHRMPCRG